jgi:hypothetical protein
MRMAVEDNNRVRKAGHAARATRDVRIPDAEATWGAPLSAAVAELQAASMGVAYERSDDDVARIARVDTATALYAGIRDAARAARTRATAAAMDQNGTIIHPELLAAVDGAIDEFLPGGASRTARPGPQLHQTGERFGFALGKLGYADLSSRVSGLAAAHGDALGAVGREIEELDAAQLRLVKARATVDRLERAGRAYATWLAEMKPELGIVPDEVYPVGARGSHEDEAAALDDAGVADEDEIDAPGEGMDDDGAE